MFHIGIVAHLDRITQAEKLADQTQAAYIAYDDGTLGCDGNHKRVWEWHAEHTTDWAIVLEDDALPVENFRQQLEQVLAQAPTPIVSLYLGRSRPLCGWQTRIGLAVVKANQSNSHWIVTDAALHAVALCVRADLVPSMLAWVQNPVDDCISRWIRAQGLKVGYPWPSLVDHEDGPTLVKHPDGQPRNQPRVAWWHGTRDHWNNRQVEM